MTRKHRAKCESPLHVNGTGCPEPWQCACGRVLCRRCERGKSGTSAVCDVCAIQPLRPELRHEVHAAPRGVHREWHDANRVAP